MEQFVVKIASEAWQIVNLVAPEKNADLFRTDRPFSISLMQFYAESIYFN